MTTHIPCTFESREGVATCPIHGPLRHSPPTGWWCEGGRVWFPFGTAFGAAAPRYQGCADDLAAVLSGVQETPDGQ